MERKTLADESSDDESSVSRLWLRAVAPDRRPDETATAGDDEQSTVVEPLGVVSETVPGGDDLAQRPRVIDRKPGGDYQLLEILGRGGMGTVWLARQAGIGRMVALKRISRKATPADRVRFVHEAQVTGGLSHPNIIPIYELGRDTESRLFYAMRPVLGEPWNRSVRSKDVEANLEILQRVVNAVGYAHSRGVLHRDLKPHNVMLGAFDEVLVSDWGLAGRQGEAEARELVGTPAYMAPEMARGDLDRVGVPTDVYLLGGILWQIITGQPPHHGENDVHTCLRWAAVNEIPAPRRPIPPHLHELRDIALRAMSTIPEDRHRSAEEFAAAIKSARRHGESQRMAERATRLFDQARISGAYEDFARAIFSFEESQAMWGGNRAAHDGAVAVRLAYAEKAMERGDLDLAASMLDEGEPAHADARTRLAQLRAQRPPSGPVDPKRHG